MHTLAKDFRYAIRRLRHAPAFTLVVALTLALGIGANTAIFSVVNAILLRPLAYRDPGQLVTIEHSYPSLKLKAPVSAPGFADYRDHTKSFSHVAVETGWGPSLTERGEPERLSGSRVSADWFAVYGVAPALGRVPREEEDRPNQNHVVVLSDALWRRLFSANTSAVGQSLILNGESYQVIGVMPPEFGDFFNRRAELWIPLALRPEQILSDGRTNEWLSLSARLKPNTTPQQAQSEMTAFAAQLKKNDANSYSRDWSLLVTALAEKSSGDVRPALLILLGAVGFVLLIACANVANLLLARGAGRLKEVAIRTALGAQRWQLVRQLLVESVLLAVVGGVLGLALAYVGVRLLVTFGPQNLPRLSEIGVDGSVALFTLVVSLLVGVLFGLAPALQASADRLHETLKEGGRGVSADRGGQMIRRVLVVAETALALMLLAGAGLLIRSFARLQAVDPGFTSSGLLTFNLALPQARYANDTTQLALWDQLMPRLAAVPGVRAVGGTSTMPFGGSWSTSSFTVEGYQPPAGQQGPWGDVRIVTTNFLPALRVPLLKGRLFGVQDGPNGAPVVVVDEELARRYWKGKDPIGRRLSFGTRRSTGERVWSTVVGVVGHTAHEGLDAERRIQVYFPVSQRPMPFMSIAVRTGGDPQRLLPSLRAAVQSIDKDLPLAQPKTMDDLMSGAIAQRRLAMLLLTVFAGIALLLACVGIYGVMAYSVAQREREIGVRMALGAGQWSVLSMVLKQGLTLTAIGLVIGVLGALAVTRLIATQLYDVRPTDPLTYAAVSALLVGIAFLATYLPARQATRLDPLIALREE